MAEQNDKDVTLFYRQATPKGRKPVKNKSAKNKKAEVGKPDPERTAEGTSEFVPLDSPYCPGE